MIPPDIHHLGTPETTKIHTNWKGFLAGESDFEFLPWFTSDYEEIGLNCINMFYAFKMVFLYNPILSWSIMEIPPLLDFFGEKLWGDKPVPMYVLFR